MDSTNSFNEHFPTSILGRYTFSEVRNAAAVLKASNPNEFADIITVLSRFEVEARDITVPGGNRGTIPKKLDSAFADLGWKAVRINTETRLLGTIKGSRHELLNSKVSNEGFEVDNLKSRVALDVEWNAKDGNLDRDLSAYRALYEVGLIDCGVLITRDYHSILDLAANDLRDLDAHRRLSSTTTTNLHKLEPRLTRGDGGGCPVLAIAITRDTWNGLP